VLAEQPQGTPQVGELGVVHDERLPFSAAGFPPA
jgi:hypothetical protein